MISGPLISAAEAISHLGSAVFLDARAGSGAREAFVNGHVQGAARADLEADLSDPGDPARGGRHPLPAWDTWLERVGGWGVGPSTPVLIYDAKSGGMAAARAWWMFRAIGHTPLAVVEGGWAALLEAGVAVAGGEPRAAPGQPYATEATGWSTLEAEEVARVRTDGQWRLLDARAPERYSGQTEPIDPVAGHIPGAQNLYWQSQQDERGMLHDRVGLRARYDSLLGDVPPERVVCYCGSGVTACHLLLAMEAVGLSGASLYVGSWSEWCRTRLDATEAE